MFIDDGSSDSTLQIAELYNRYEHNKVICFSEFLEKPLFMQDYHMLVEKYNCIIDADLQQSPEVVKEMEELLDLNDDVDCVCISTSKT